MVTNTKLTAEELMRFCLEKGPMKRVQCKNMNSYVEVTTGKDDFVFTSIAHMIVAGCTHEFTIAKHVEHGEFVLVSVDPLGLTLWYDPTDTTRDNYEGTFEYLNIIASPILN